MRIRAFNLVLILGGVGLLCSLPSTARAGYISDATQHADLFLAESNAGGATADESPRETKPLGIATLFEIFGPLAYKGSMDAGSGVGTPSVSGPGSSLMFIGLYVPVTMPETELTTWLAAASHSSRPPPHVDRLFRPPRFFAAL